MRQRHTICEHPICHTAAQNYGDWCPERRQAYIDRQYVYDISVPGMLSKVRTGAKRRGK